MNKFYEEQVLGWNAKLGTTNLITHVKKHNKML